MIIQIFFCLFAIFNLKKIIKIISFLRILGTILLIYTNFKINGKTRELLVLNLYEQIINSDCYTIKFSQWIVSRLDMLYLDKEKPKWLHYFYNIYEKCNSHNLEYTENTFNSDFPNFKTFNQYIIRDSLVLVGSGSIGQVYKATTFDNQVVAIKCKHPGIDDNFFIIYYFLTFAHFVINNFPIINKYVSIPINLENFFNSIKSQTDFNQEAKYMKTAYKYLEDEENFVVPKCIMHSRNIIIMSYEEGKSIEEFNISGYGKNKITIMLLLLLRDLIYMKGFLHADLHQGNWKVKKISENEYKIILYDFGICRDFSENTKMVNFLRDFFYAWDKADYKTLVSTLKYFIHKSKHSIKYIETNCLVELEKKLKNASLRPVNVSSVSKNILSWCRKNHITLNSIFLDIMLTSSLLEKTFKKYGIIGEKEYTKEGFNCVENCFKSDWLDWINFMNTYQCFPELNKYMQGKLEKENIEFDQLFYKLDEKILKKKERLVMDF